MTPIERVVQHEQLYSDDLDGHSEPEIDRDLESETDEPFNLEHLPDHNDRRLLEESEQEERLLTKPSRWKSIGHSTKQTEVQRRKRRNDKRSRRLSEGVEGGGNVGLMYEMEGGYKDSSLRSSTESLLLMDQKWNQEDSHTKSFTRILVIAVVILTMFLALAYASYNASHHKQLVQALSNGTHIFQPTTILISLDGFRADFLQRGLTPTMKAMIESGVSPKYMMPSFPSLTFPNHFTLVTGLYPESHGIVGNQFWDPQMQEEFYYTNISNSMQPKWWNAEPIWVTAENAGLKTAVHMWPGSEAHIGNLDPTYLDKYNGKELLSVKVDRMLHWLDMSVQDRPQLIAAYVPNVDSDGHQYGPNSTEIRATIVEVDNMLTDLIEGLLNRNLTEIVNIVIVSDHGMATTSNERLIQLDNLIDLSLIDHIDGWPLRGLRLRNPDRDVPILHQQLLDASKNLNFDVYTMETMPERYHFTNNDRIAPLWVVPQTGWAVVEKEEFDIAEAKKTGQQYSPLGLHGYDHEHPLMRAIFIARGPAFPHAPNSRIAAFQNTEVYNIVCDSLGIRPHANNGTLRLPFRTEGLHSDFSDNTEIPADPPTPTSGTAMHTNADATYNSLPTSSVSPTAGENKPLGDDSDGVPDKPEKTHSKWWIFLHEQIEKAKAWAKQMVDSIKNNNPSANKTIERP